MERINPGGTIEVRGVDFDYDEPVALSLMRSQIQIPLMEITADGEGIFTQVVVLPADLPAGKYNLRARSDHHLVMSPTIMVWGTPVENSEETGIRDQSDIQFGSLPTVVAEIASTSIPQSKLVDLPVAGATSTMPIYWVLAGVGIVAFLGVWMFKKR